MRLFEDILKARKKSMYAIGKHPNSHRRKGTTEEVSDVSPTQRLFLETMHYRTGGRFRQPTAKWAVKTGHATYDFDSDSYKLTDKGRKAIQEKAPDDKDTLESIANVNKPIHPKARIARKEALRELIKHQPDARERGIGIDLDTGERIYDTMGTTGRGHEWDADFERPHVPMADALRARADRKRTLEYHTHPGQHDTGPSEGDWSVFVNASQMHEMRVVARDRVFSMRKTEQFYKMPRKTRTGFQAKRRWDEMVEEEFQSKRHDTVDKMIDAANKRMASEFGIKYSVVNHRRKPMSKLFSEIFKAFSEAKVRRDAKGRFSTKIGVGTGVTQDGEKRWRTKDGKEADAETVARIKELRVPPAWRDVRVNPDHKAGLQAVGFDAKGRPTALYSAAHHEAQAAKKFERLKKFTHVRDKLLQRAVQDAADGNEEAAALVLLGKTGMRIGSDRDTGAKVQAYGATTLQARHVSVTGSVTAFDFIGKKGVSISLTSIDADLARVMKGRLKGKTGEARLFQTNDKKVRDYLQRIGGSGFMPKDFRTYVATSTAIDLVHGLGPAAGDKEFRRMRKEVATKVSRLLGNTPAMAIASYIDPAVWHRIHPLRKAS